MGAIKFEVIELGVLVEEAKEIDLSLGKQATTKKKRSHILYDFTHPKWVGIQCILCNIAFQKFFFFSGISTLTSTEVETFSPPTASHVACIMLAALSALVFTHLSDALFSHQNSFQV